MAEPNLDLLRKLVILGPCSCLREAPDRANPDEPVPDPPIAGDRLEQLAAEAATQRAERRARVIRTGERHTAVHHLLAQGKGIKAIVRELGLAQWPCVRC